MPGPALSDPFRNLHRPIALAGFGVEGRGTLRFLRRRGERDIVVFDRVFDRASSGSGESGDPDLKGLTCIGGEDWSGAMAACRTVVRSPGIRPDHPSLAAAREAGARITSATELFLASCPGPVVGVTGTLGKGTTVSLIEVALKAAGIPCRIGGNIGVNPLAFLEELTPETVTVLELSSFQLMDLPPPLPKVAVILRTSAEHLDWHADASEYRNAKMRLLAPPGTGQCVIYCADSEGSREIVARHLEDNFGTLAVSRDHPVREGIGVESEQVGNGRVFRYISDVGTPLPELERLSLPGKFNLENAAAAFLAVESVAGESVAGESVAGESPGVNLPGAEERHSLEAIASFPGLPHRLEKVGQVGGVVFYNDSYATRPDATLGAILSFRDPLALILGGSEKHADFAPLAETLCGHPSLKKVVLIGASAPRIGEELKAAARKLHLPPLAVLNADTLEAAFAMAREGLPAGGVLLFSPACASFDMFANYKERGERFKALVAEMSEAR